MKNIEQERLNLLFQMESIKAPLMQYIAPGVSLKIVTDLGAKDQNGNKKRFYEETLYKSDKYANTSHLISSNFRFNTYLLLEYPNPQFQEGVNTMRNHCVFIRAYAIDDIVAKMKEFNDGFVNAYKLKDGKLYVVADKAKEVTVYPSMSSSLTFKNDIYQSADGSRVEMGVRVIINNEFSMVLSAETTWPELVYKLSRCDLIMLGFQMVQSYMSLLPGMAVSEIGSSRYVSASRYTPYWGEDPDDVINQPDAVKVNRSKPLTNEEKKKSFFSDL